MLHSILVVDDDPQLCELFSAMLEDEYRVDTVGSAEEGLLKARQNHYLAIIHDVYLPGMNGVEALKSHKAQDPNIQVIMVTGSREVDTAVEAMHAGAFDYFTKPFNQGKVKTTLQRIIEREQLQDEVAYLRDSLSEVAGYGDIIGNSSQMQGVFSVMQEMEKNDATVLIQGKSGTGKELVARSIHYNGVRAKGAFIAVNCAAIPLNLLESELFGYEKGAFTGAVGVKKGKIELASGGTLFLDEIHALPMDMQAKLLRVLQENELERVGGTRTIRLNFRLLAAANVSLRQAVSEGTFREDLFYRVHVVPIDLPELTDRQGDILLLVDHFITVFNTKYSKKIQTVDEHAMALLRRYTWPGNVRELRNVLERVVVLSKGSVIEASMLPMELEMIRTVASPELTEPTQQTGFLKDAKGEFEKRMLIQLFKKHKGNQSQVARDLGVHRNTIIKKKKKYNIDVMDWRS